MPRRASSTAQAMPVGPAPTIATGSSVRIEAILAARRAAARSSCDRRGERPARTTKRTCRRLATSRVGSAPTTSRSAALPFSIVPVSLLDSHREARRRASRRRAPASASGPRPASPPSRRRSTGRGASAGFRRRCPSRSGCRRPTTRFRFAQPIRVRRSRCAPARRASVRLRPRLERAVSATFASVPGSTQPFGIVDLRGASSRRAASRQPHVAVEDRERRAVDRSVLLRQGEELVVDRQVVDAVDEQLRARPSARPSPRRAPSRGRSAAGRACFASSPAASTAASEASTGMVRGHDVPDLDGVAPRRGEVAHAGPRRRPASFRKMNCRSAGRFSQWSIVERSGPAAATRGAAGSSRVAMRHRDRPGVAADVEDGRHSRAEMRSAETLGMGRELRLDLLVRIPVAHVERVGPSVGPAGLREMDVRVDQPRHDPHAPRRRSTVDVRGDRAAALPAHSILPVAQQRRPRSAPAGRPSRPRGSRPSRARGGGGRAGRRRRRPS